jgi:hypothetical protein
MRKVTISITTFMAMLTGLIASGVTFEAKEVDGFIEVSFTGGY